MSVPFFGEIRLFPFTLLPDGWKVADGSLMPIAGNGALFSLLGITYGGDGKTTFALPDLRGRVPLCQGLDDNKTSHLAGEKGGVEAIELSTLHLPTHTHRLQARNIVGKTGNATNARIAIATKDDLTPKNDRYLFGGPGNLTVLHPDSISWFGSEDPAKNTEEATRHYDNMQPFAVLRFCIAVTGIYPVSF